MKSSVPAATVSRLPVYLRCLAELSPAQDTISSDQLAAMAGVNSAQVRKDLSYLGSYGVRGVGYKVSELQTQVHRTLGLSRECAVAIVGAGNLGTALANYGGFADWGFRVVRLFDSEQAKVGNEVGGVPVDSINDLEREVAEHKISIGIIATPAHAAQDVADRLVAAGIRSILNFAPIVLHVPAGTAVRRVDLSTELQILSYYLGSAREAS